ASSGWNCSRSATPRFVSRAASSRRAKLSEVAESNAPAATKMARFLGRLMPIRLSVPTSLPCRPRLGHEALPLLDHNPSIRRHARRHVRLPARPGDLHLPDLRRAAQPERERQLALRELARARLDHSLEAAPAVQPDR